MERIESGKYVELGYDLYSIKGDNERLVHQTDEADPERLIFGVTPGVIEPLAKAIEGLSVGDEFDVVVKAADAFGPYDPEQIATLPRDIFMVDGKFDTEAITPGAVLPMMTADGYRINGIVKEVTDTDVKMDFNHPLAGKDVRFKGKIITVRDATPEELAPQHCCGCGCDHDHDHCGDHDCGCDHDHCDSCH